MFLPINSKQKPSNNYINKKSNSQLKTTLPLMTTKNLVESAWAEDMDNSFTTLIPTQEKLQEDLEN